LRRISENDTLWQRFIASEERAEYREWCERQQQRQSTIVAKSSASSLAKQYFLHRQALSQPSLQQYEFLTSVVTRIGTGESAEQTHLRQPLTWRERTMLQMQESTQEYEFTMGRICVRRTNGDLVAVGHYRFVEKSTFEASSSSSSSSSTSTTTSPTTTTTANTSADLRTMMKIRSFIRRHELESTEQRTDDTHGETGVCAYVGPVLGYVLFRCALDHFDALCALFRRVGRGFVADLVSGHSMRSIRRASFRLLDIVQPIRHEQDTQFLITRRSINQCRYLSDLLRAINKRLSHQVRGTMTSPPYASLAIEPQRYFYFQMNDYARSKVPSDLKVRKKGKRKRKKKEKEET
jgi:hypothetical protein